MKLTKESNIKIHLDKYYTPSNIAEACVSKALKIIGRGNITDVIEPAAGAGVFLDVFEKLNIKYTAYDIEPEDSRIIKQDYLKLNKEYRRGRLIIGNPPYGEKNILSVKFYNKSVDIGDYIAFILPISQYKNDLQMYKFDLISSEDLGIQEYSGRKIHCCFNIYKRNAAGLKKRRNNKLKDITIIERRLAKREERPDKYDIRMCAWGSLRVLDCNDRQYAKEFYILIHNEKLKKKIVDVITTTNWAKEYSMTATPNLLHWQVYKTLKERIPEIK